MTTTAQAWTEEMVELAGTSVQLVKGGSGEPAVSREIAPGLRVYSRNADRPCVACRVRPSSRMLSGHVPG